MWNKKVGLQSCSEPFIQSFGQYAQYFIWHVVFSRSTRNILQWNLPITERQGTIFFFGCRQVSFNKSTWSWIKAFRYRQDSVPPRFSLRQVSLYRQRHVKLYYTESKLGLNCATCFGTSSHRSKSRFTLYKAVRVSLLSCPWEGQLVSLQMQAYVIQLQCSGTKTGTFCVIQTP